MASAAPTNNSQSGLALVESLQRHREDILNKIREANGMTEREVLAVGEALKLIVDEARAYVADSRKTLEEVASTSLTHMFERHGERMTHFVTAMQTQVAAQSEAARQATSQINGIVELGRAIDRVTMESKILALNANIQARRLGAAGEAFQVIAQEMRHFSESVNDANKGVQELASGLLDVLPRIEALSTRIGTVSEDFSRDVSDRVAEVASSSSGMRERIATGMAVGESRLQEILRLSYDALSHLQFQDPVAQVLLGCDGDMKECLRLAENWAAGGTLEGGEPEPTSGPESDSLLDSGEVLLF